MPSRMIHCGMRVDFDSMPALISRLPCTPPIGQGRLVTGLAAQQNPSGVTGHPRFLSLAPPCVPVTASPAVTLRTALLQGEANAWRCGRSRKLGWEQWVNWVDEKQLQFDEGNRNEDGRAGGR